MTPARFIISSDLHQKIVKWRELVRVVKREQPRFVLIAGDLLPKNDGFNGQKVFFQELADYLGEMRGSGETTILTFFGNDDFHPLEPLLDDLAAKGLCVNLNGKVHRQDDLVFCGMNFVRDYPFGYKQTYCGSSRTLNRCWDAVATSTNRHTNAVGNGRRESARRSGYSRGRLTSDSTMSAWRFPAI